MGWRVVTRISPLALLVGGAFFMELLDGSIVTTALPRMAESFGVDPVGLNPAVSVYLLTVAVFILPSGWLADRFGARVVFTAAIGVFTVSSVLCALCSSAPLFIACRVAQGVGGAMMVPVGRLVVLRTTAKAELMNAIAVLTWPGLTAPVLGPPLGGFIAEFASWRWIFLLNVPLGVAGMVLALQLVPSVRGRVGARFDWAGFLLAAACCVAVTVGLELAGAGAPVWVVVGLGVATVVLGVLLGGHVRRTAHPLIGMGALRVGSFRVSLLGGSLMRVLISTMPFLLPLLFQLGFGMDPFHAGLLVLALFAGNIGIKPLTSPILRRWSFRHVLLGNGLLQAGAMAGCAVMAAWAPGAGVVVPLLVLAGASRSLQFTALNTLAFAEVPERHMGEANTLFSLAFQFSNGMGVAVGALALRWAGGGYGGAAGAGAFSGAFGGIAVLMAVASFAALRVAPDAAAVVRGKG